MPRAAKARERKVLAIWAARKPDAAGKTADDTAPLIARRATSLADVLVVSPLNGHVSPWRRVVVWCARRAQHLEVHAMSGTVRWSKLIGSFAALAFCATLAPVIQPAQAADKETPESFVRRVYARYRTGGPGVPTDRKGGAAFYAPALLDAFEKDEAAAHGEVGTVDGDPLCNCQDFGKLRVTRVAISPGDADAVKATVDFTNLGSRETINLSLVATAAGWRIADVGDKTTKSLKALLQKAAAQPR